MVRCTSCGGPANPDEGVVEVISPLRLVTLGKLLNLQIVNLVKMVSIVKLLSKPSETCAPSGSILIVAMIAF